MWLTCTWYGNEATMIITLTTLTQCNSHLALPLWLTSAGCITLRDTAALHFHLVILVDVSTAVTKASVMVFAMETWGQAIV